MHNSDCEIYIVGMGVAYVEFWYLGDRVIDLVLGYFWLAIRLVLIHRSGKPAGCDDEMQSNVLKVPQCLHFTSKSTKNVFNQVF